MWLDWGEWWWIEGAELAVWLRSHCAPIKLSPLVSLVASDGGVAVLSELVFDYALHLHLCVSWKSFGIHICLI